MTLIFLILVLISILQGFYFKEPITVVFNNLGQLDSSNQIFYNVKGSSWEGHALLMLQGYGFMVNILLKKFQQISTLTLNCVFTSLAGNNIYKSRINNNQAVCVENDYYCLYWQTIYQTSDTTLGCYTPRIPYKDRAMLMSAKNYNAFQVYLEVIDTVNNLNYRIDCPTSGSWKCQLTYHDNFTPQIVAFGPAHIYVGSSPTMWTTPRYNDLINLRGIRIGQGVCRPQVPDSYSDNWSIMNFPCTTGSEMTAEASVGGFLIDYSYGQPSVNTLRKRYEIDPTVTQNMYYFKVFPIIRTVSQSSGLSLGGQSITITGNGFSLSDTQVYINKDQCVTELSIATNQISCVTPAVTFDYTDTTNTYLGSHGLRRRFYTNLPNASINGLIRLDGFPDSTSHLSIDEVILESKTLPFSQVNYGQFMQGYFLATYTGSYRFWSSSDDGSQLWLSTDETSQNLVKIIDFGSYTLNDDYITKRSQTTSQWINLIQDTYYYMEIIHVQGGGAEHYQLGVEVNSTDISSSDPNLATNFDRVDIYPTVVEKDLYQVLVNTLTQNVTTLTCKMLDDKTINTMNIDPTSSANTFRGQLSSLINDWNLIVRKVGYNDAGLYYLADGQTFDDSSHTAAYNFGDEFLNLNGAFSNTSIPLVTVNNGTQTGVAFLVFFDEVASQRTFDLSKRCNVIINKTITTVTNLQTVSPSLNGTISFLVTSTLDNTRKNTTLDFPINTFSKLAMYNLLNQVPLLTDHIELFYAGSGNDNITFYIRYSSEANVVLTVNTNNLTGGVDNSPLIAINSAFDNSGNLFFMPIPPDFLYVSNPSPQIRVVSNGLEAVCFSGVCSYQIDQGTYPTILSYTLDTTAFAVTVTLDFAFTDPTIVSAIGFGENVCGSPLNFDAPSFTYSCLLSQPIIGGTYSAYLSTNLGFIASNADNTVSIPISITSVSPAQVLTLGGATITIQGTGFPVNDLTGIQVTAGGSACLVQTASNTAITCVVGPGTTSDPLLLTYYGVNANADPNIFSYIAPNTNPPNVLSITPSSVSPGEKQTLAILLDQDISSYNLATVVVTLIHTTIANYKIQMNPFSISTTTLNVRYGGATIGIYNLYVQLDSTDYANSIITFQVTVSITSMFPMIGSIMGGTTVYIYGENFLSTQLNQVVYIGTTPCTYVYNDNSIITCITQVPNSSTPKDVLQSVAVEQMIQYDSICLDTNSNCGFTYSTANTSTVYNIMSADGDYSFQLNDPITISGSNMQFANTPYIIEYSWGVITVTSATDSQIIGTISNIAQYGVSHFVFSDDNGIAIQLLTGFSLIPGQTNLLIFLEKPLAISSISTTSIGEYGAIFKFYTDATDFQSNTDANGNILNAVTICNVICKVLATNILSDDNNNFQCIINTMTSSSSFTSCPVQFSYYQNVTTLENITISSSGPNDRKIKSITIDGNDVSSNSFTINNSSNFVLKITLNSIDSSLTDLNLIANNAYVFALNPQATTVTASGNAVYEFDLTSGLPAGLVTCAIHSDSLGFLMPPNPIKNSSNKPTSYFNLPINAYLTSLDSMQITTSSFYGGVSTTITGNNLNNIVTSPSDQPFLDSNSFQQVYVCDMLAEVTQYSSTSITFRTPAILKYDFFSTKNIIKENQINLKFDNTYSMIIEETSDSDHPDISALFDNNPFTSITTSLTSWIGIGVKSSTNPQYKILLNRIQIIVGQLASPDDFTSAYIEGSNDGSTWVQLATLPGNLLLQWTNIYLDPSKNAPFSLIRLVPNAVSSLSEVRVYGNVVFQSTSTTAGCAVRIIDNFNDITINNLSVLYDIAKTYTISTITPANGPSVGDTSVTFELSSGNTVSQDDVVLISIYGNPITASITVAPNGIDLVATTAAKKNTLYDPSSPLVILIDSVGYVYSDIYYQYLDRWSDVNTWGGEFIPANGETAFITNSNIILDVPNINLNTLVIENGSLTVEDTRDYNFSANIILIRSGTLTIGTEDNPFQNNFVLTLKGKRTDPTLPIFGNKVLAVLEGILEIHGIAKTPTFTYLSATYPPGTSVINVAGPVNWAVGDQIVIASSNITPLEAELFTIINITNASQGVVTITLNKSLQYYHYGEINTYGTSDQFDMRAEVAILTRNVIIQGDKNSVSTQYGAHVMLTAMNMNMNKESTIVTSGKISNVEVRHAGQAYQQGRYPLHFHMIGDITGSYIKGCSVHNTYNRAITVHGVTNFLVDSNVAYDVMGHTFFIEDGVETYNTISNNIGLWTRPSSSLLNSDTNPATFWITNPSNYIFGNHAAGSEFYGMWMDIPVAPTGLNIGLPGCPQNLPLGSFHDNVSHSNEHHGIRIFPKYDPINKNCGIINGSTVVTVQAVFSNLTTYANGLKGIITEQIGNVIFVNSKSSDHSESNMEVSNLNQFPEGMAGFHNNFIVGISKNPAVNREGWNIISTKGLVTPRADRFIVDNIRFYNMKGLSLFSSCSRCDVAPPSTDSDGRTIYFQKISSDKSESSKVFWTQPRRAIYRDLDGTLTGSTGAAWATPYYIHNNVKECVRNIDMWNDGSICDDTIQVRRIAISDVQPSNTFRGQNMKIMRLFNQLDDINMTDLNNKTNFSSIPFKELRNPNNGWAVAYVTGYNYLISFADVGLNFNSLRLERSIMWDTLDLPINLVFNYTYRRDEFSVIGTDNSGKNYVVNNITDLSLINGNFMTSNNNTEYGTFYNNINTTLPMNLNLRVNGYNPQKYTNQVLTVTAIQCANNDCGLTPPSGVKENFTRKWSDVTNWPNNVLPADGDIVEILYPWNMILDVSTPELQLLTISGLLFFDPTQSNLKLAADNIFIFGGILQIGNSTSPYINKATVMLSGSQISANIAINNTIQTTNNAMINIGTIQIYGEDRSPYVSRLQVPASKGDTSITVDKSLKWGKNDTITLTTTTFDTSETELLTIVSYDNTTGIIEFTPSLQNYHYGAVNATVFPDNTLNPLVNLDERAEVYMLSRNITITGNSNLGGNIFTTMSTTPDFVYYGVANISHAQITNCGQTDTDFSALQFVQHNGPNSASLIDGVSFYSNPSVGIHVDTSSNITFNNVILFQPKRFGVEIINSHNIIVQDTSVVQMLNRTYPTQLKINDILDTNACYLICVGSGVCQNVNLINTTCAGSQSFGYVVNSLDCETDLTQNFSYSYVYSTQNGYLVMNTLKSSCMKSGNVVTYNNMVGYVVYAPADLSVHENLLSSNNFQGIVILAASSDLNTRKILNRALIIGQNSDNPICYDTTLCTTGEICKQIGFLLSITSVGKGLPFPITTMNIPIYNPKGDAAYGSFFNANDVSFVNFEGQCNYDQFAINSNPFESDASSVHNFKGVTLAQVYSDNLIFFELPSQSWIGKGQGCGYDFPCSGPNNVLVKISNFNQSKQTSNNNNSANSNNRILNGATQSYIVPNNKSALLPILDGIEFISANPIQSMVNCTAKSSWNGLACNPGRNLGVLWFENLDSEANERNLSPINITTTDSTDPFFNKLNTFMDHACQFGYPSFKRTPRFLSIVPLGKTILVNFTSTTPKNMKFQLVDADWDNSDYTFGTYTYDPSTQKKSGIVITMQYQSPLTVVVFNLNTKIEIKPKTYLENQAFDDFTCGGNKWTPIKNTLEFYITNTPDCSILLNTVDSVQLSMRLALSVSQFYANNGANSLVYNIAAILGIPINQIRVSGVRTGSTIIDMGILSSVPTLSITDGSPVISDTTVPLNLTDAATVIYTSITTNALILPAPLLAFSAQVVETVANPSNPSPSNGNISINPGGVTITYITLNYPINLDKTTIKTLDWIKYMLIIICTLIGLVIVCFGVYCLIVKLKATNLAINHNGITNEDPNMIEVIPFQVRSGITTPTSLNNFVTKKGD